MVDKALISYLRQCFSMGYKYEQIRPKIVSHGWSEKEIENALLQISRAEVGSHPDFFDQVDLPALIITIAILGAIIWTALILY